MRLFKVALATFLFSFSAWSIPEVEKLVVEYNLAMVNGDKKKIKSLVTKEYYTDLNRNRLLERLFKTKKNKKSRKAEDYQVEVIESKVVKGSIMAGVKLKGEKEQDWYKIKKVKNKYLVEEEVHSH